MTTRARRRLEQWFRKLWLGRLEGWSLCPCGRIREFRVPPGHMLLEREVMRRGTSTPISRCCNVPYLGIWWITRRRKWMRGIRGPASLRNSAGPAQRRTGDT